MRRIDTGGGRGCNGRGRRGATGILGSVPWPLVTGQGGVRHTLSESPLVPAQGRPGRVGLGTARRARRGCAYEGEGVGEVGGQAGEDGDDIGETVAAAAGEEGKGRGTLARPRSSSRSLACSLSFCISLPIY